MKTEHYEKTYTVEEGYNKNRLRWFAVCDGRRTSLNYANKDFAMKKAESFVKQCHKDFTREYMLKPEYNTRITFSFKQV